MFTIGTAVALALFGALLFWAAKGRPDDWNARPYRWIPMGGLGWQRFSTKDRTRALAIIALAMAILEFLLARAM